MMMYGGRIDSEKPSSLRIQMNTYLVNSIFTELLTQANPKLEEITQDNL
jgi:hypothetical protein